MAALQHGAVRSVSPAYSHRVKTLESRQPAGRSTGRREEVKHETARQERQFKVRWKNTGVLASQAIQQDTKAKY